VRILVANDDGIYSPGLRALARAARQFGDVQIVAPDVEQSSMGHAITHSRPLRIRRTPIDDFDAYRVNGTPADCVALGVDSWGGVDIVLSGINLGYNLGNSMWHSGTLAAAKQAALLGTRGVALSTPTGGDEPDFARLDPFVAEVLSVPDGARGVVEVGEQVEVGLDDALCLFDAERNASWLVDLVESHASDVDLDVVDMEPWHNEEYKCEQPFIDANRE